MARKRIGDLLIENGSITESELKMALDLQKQQGGKVGNILIQNRIITEEQLATTLAVQLDMDYIDLKVTQIPSRMAELIPKNIAKQHQVVAVRETPDAVYVAMNDPLNLYAVNELRKVIRRRVVPMMATASGIEQVLNLLYGSEAMADAMEEAQRRARAEGTPETSAAFTVTQLGMDDAGSAPTVRLVNSIIERAVTEHASDIHIEPRENQVDVRYRIDGLLNDALQIPKNMQASVAARIKNMASLDITERRIPQDGRFPVQLREKTVDLRVSTLPTAFGENIVLRLLDKSSGVVTKDVLGMSSEDMEKFEKLIHYHNGVLLIVGPTGSGKSTTMYAMIGELNTRDVNLITLEDPVEYNIDGVNQVQINEKVNMTFANGLRAILRQDPDIVAIGEIRDQETADIAMRAALTGRFVLSTIHTNDAVGAIERLEDIGVEPYLIASTLRGVISQRLVRRICPQCMEEAEGSEEDWERLGVEPEERFQLYRGGGCQYCRGSGYSGRIGLFEILPVDREVRRIIAGRRGRDEIERYLSQPSTGFVTLRQSGIRALRGGVSTIEEVLRVVNDQEG